MLNLIISFMISICMIASVEEFNAMSTSQQNALTNQIIIVDGVPTKAQ